MEVGRKYLWIGGLLQLVVVLLVCCQQPARAAPDGINFYKDMLRGKNEEDDYAAMLSAEEELGEPKLFFYRTPVASFAGFNMDDAFNKRTVNKYKNMMLTKDVPEVLLEDREPIKESSRMYFPRVTPKRSPGAILSWAIPAANRVRVMTTNYRPPGINRPAA